MTAFRLYAYFDKKGGAMQYYCREKNIADNKTTKTSYIIYSSILIILPPIWKFIYLFSILFCLCH